VWASDVTHCSREEKDMHRTDTSLALTMKDAAKLVGVDYRTIKLGIESGTIPTVQLGPRRMIPRVPLLRAFGVDAK
jgi:excisionase family DNA binding protein